MIIFHLTGITSCRNGQFTGSLRGQTFSTNSNSPILYDEALKEYLVINNLFVVNNIVWQEVP